MVKAVIFDMYETLVTLWYSEPYMGKEISADAGIPESTFREIWNPTETERAIGVLTYEEVIERILRVNNRYSDELFQMLVRKRKESKVEAFDHVHPEIIPLLEGLKKKGLKIGLITNCFKEEKDAIEDCELIKYFDVVCMSCELGIKKPDRKIFDICLERLGLAAEDCLYCGDGGSNELAVAKEMNMKPVQALWYLKDGVGQPVGRMEEYMGAKRPMEILELVDVD